MPVLMAFSLDMSKMEEKSKQIDKKRKGKDDGDFRDLNFVNLVEGQNVVRILPPWSDEGVPGREVHFHGNVPVSRTKTRKKKCPLLTSRSDDRDEKKAKVPCPLHDAMKVLEDNGEEIPESMYVQKKVALNVIMRANPSNSKAPDEDEFGILMITGRTYDDIINKIIYNARKPIDITHPEHGLDIEITMDISKTDSGRNRVRYSAAALPGETSSPIFEDEARQNEVLDNLYDLDTIFSGMSRKSMAELLEIANDFLSHMGFSHVTLGEDKYQRSEQSDPKEAAEAGTENEKQSVAQAAEEAVSNVTDGGDNDSQTQASSSETSSEEAESEDNSDSSSSEEASSQNGAGAGMTVPEAPEGLPKGCPGWTEHDEDKMVCQVCPHELTCQEASDIAAEIRGAL